TLNTPCYSPQEMRRAYGLTPVLDAGFDGRGQTIVIVDSFGSPTIQNDLRVFDAGYGLPNPPAFEVRAPLGPSPAFDPTNSDMVAWAVESTLDVEWAHAMAPGANIVLLTSPVSETEGVQGMPEFMALEQYALDRHLGQIISQSWGATEQTLLAPDGQALRAGFEKLYRKAADNRVTVLASDGDNGVANADLNGQTFPFRTVVYPASSPWVTAVGGTSLEASTRGQYQSEVVWNDGPTSGATGGGVSALYNEPDYQRDNLPSSVQSLLSQHRGLPDVAYDADPNTPVLAYVSFIPGLAGFYAVGGTSEGAPQWAGIIADGNQMARRPLGFLNPALYRIGHQREARSFHDVTTGNNSQDGITGYDATAGWDATTGWGSPRADDLLRRLAGDRG
ncbi:MAG: S53 family peptidase, partial [Chloroflexota bacterium]